MTDTLGLGQQLILVWLGFVLCISLTISLSLRRFILPRLQRLSARQRSSSLWALASAPAPLAALLAALCLFPSALSFAWPQLDHCLTHADEHVHLCLIHGKAASLGVFWLLPLWATLTWVSWRLLCWVRQHWRASRLLSTLERTASYDEDHDIYDLDIDAPAAFMAGLVRGRVFISRALKAQLNARELALVIAHERAHLRRYDNIRRASAELLSLFYLPPTRRALLHALDLSCEQASDDIAATSTLERLQLAQVLLRLTRILHDAVSLVPHASNANSHLKPRIEALLRPAREELPLSRKRRLWPLALSLLMFASTHTLHHTAETILGMLLKC